MDDLFIVPVYISPSYDLNYFCQLLDKLRNSCANINFSKCIICGDFNARSLVWGCNTVNSRGRVLEEWMAERDLRLCNVGNVATCVRPQRSSVIDLTWTSPALFGNVSDWHVIDGLPSLSDHRYIFFVIQHGSGHRVGSNGLNRYLRWSLKDFKKDLFCAILEFKCSSFDHDCSAAECAKWIADCMKEASDLAAKRVSSGPARRSMYWCEEVAEARRRCIAANRKRRRIRRRVITPLEHSFELEYRVAKRRLCSEIRKAKNRAWRELIRNINKDPWGLLYKVVMNRLRHASPGFTEDYDTLSGVLDSLFPVGAIHDPIELWLSIEVPLQDCVVDASEVQLAIRSSRRSGSPAPGPDGIVASVWRCIPPSFVIKLAETFTKCLKDGVFPAQWKRAKLVLIPKGGASTISMEGSLPKARPICLLDEVGKIFERIIVGRIKTFMEDNPRSRLSRMQYGFCEGRSTLDALETAVGIIERSVFKGGYAIAVSLDIKNAFNSLPWPSIRWALERMNFPLYLRRIIDAYLSDRVIEFPSLIGLCERNVTCGVPQGSVLGPLLWNLTYNYVLDVTPMPGCKVIGYADDTLIVGTHKCIYTIRSRVNKTLKRVLNRLEAVGLSVAAEKTEAVLFYGRKRPDSRPMVRVGQTLVRLSPQLKYLGIILD